MQDRIRKRLGRICSSVPLTCDSLTGTAAKIWIIQEDCDPIPKADLVIANLVAEYIGIARLVQMVKESQAKYVSVLVWDNRNKKSLAAFTGKAGKYRCVTVQEMVGGFQANWLDLIYMRENIEEDGALFVRLDFKAVQWG